MTEALGTFKGRGVADRVSGHQMALTGWTDCSVRPAAHTLLAGCP